LTPELILAIGGMILSAGIAYGIVKHSLDDLIREVSKLREWRHNHEKEASDERLKIHDKMSDLRVSEAANDEKFKAIMDAIEDIRNRLTKP
jgi:predicted  nucleic acid-binding Zn-ribbon protein